MMARQWRLTPYMVAIASSFRGFQFSIVATLVPNLSLRLHNEI
jgi:hypothetical protein